MTNEQLRMQMLSGIITEGEYKAKLEELNNPKEKESLKENFVGTGAINNPFIEREKTDYEIAFEHFNKGSLSENEEVEETVNEALQNDDLIYNRMLGMDQEQLVSMILSFAENNPSITLVDYLNDEFGYEEDLEEGKEVEEPNNY